MNLEQKEIERVLKWLLMKGDMYMTQENLSIEKNIKSDPFYSAENIAELERRIQGINSGTAALKEHELIEADD